MGLRRKTGEEEPPKLYKKNMGSKAGVVLLGMAAVADLAEHGQVTFILDKLGEVRQVEPRQVTIRKPTPEEVIQLAVTQGKDEEEIFELISKVEALPDDPREWTL